MEVFERDFCGLFTSGRTPCVGRYKGWFLIFCNPLFHKELRYVET